LHVSRYRKGAVNIVAIRVRCGDDVTRRKVIETVTIFMMRKDRKGLVMKGSSKYPLG